MDFSLSPDQDAYLATRPRVRARPRRAGRREDRRDGRVSARARDRSRRARPDGRHDAAARPAAPGCDYVTYAMAIEAVAQASATLAVILTVNNSLVVEPLAEFGTDAQRERWLAPLASGRADRRVRAVGGQRRVGRRQSADASRAPDDGGYVITGTKVWVANAEARRRRDRVCVDRAGRARARHQRVSGAARTRRASRAARRIRSACADWAAWTSSSATCAWTRRALLGELGRGFRLAMRALEGGRIAIAAQALGVGQAALDEALAYARRREVFGQSIGDFQAVQFQLADLATDLEAARMLTWRAADSHDRKPRVVARGVDGQAAGVGSRAPRRRSRDADSGVGGLPPRIDDRAVVPGRARRGDLSGHVRSAADDHRRASDGSASLTSVSSHGATEVRTETRNVRGASPGGTPPGGRTAA